MTEQEPQGTAPSIARVKCSKCGFENQPDLKFCGNCGAKLKKDHSVPKNRSEVLGLLYFTGAVYLLLSLVLNQLVRSTILFSVPYLVAGVVGLYVGYSFYTGRRVNRTLSALSILVIVIGLVFTALLFAIGLGAKGVIGPSWVIFAVTAFALWKRNRRRNESENEE